MIETEPVPAGLTTTPSGLVVPPEAFPPRQTLRFDSDAVRTVRRALKQLTKMQIGVVLVCLECQTVVQQERVLDDRGNDEVVLRCRHLERRARGVL